MFKVLSIDALPAWVKKFNVHTARDVVKNFRDDNTAAFADQLLNYLAHPNMIFEYVNNHFPFDEYANLYDFPKPVLAVIEYLADLGHGESLYELGQACMFRSDLDSAINYFTLALENGETDALYHLGVLQDDLAQLKNTGPKGAEAKKAVVYFKLAFEAKDKQCVLSGTWLAMAYSTGFGVAENQKEAFAYNVRMASLQPSNSFHETDGGSTNVESLYHLGKDYLEGKAYAEKSLKTACKYFRRAADAVHLEEDEAFLACYELGQLAADGCIYAFVAGACPDIVSTCPLHVRSALLWMIMAKGEGEEWVVSNGHLF